MGLFGIGGDDEPSVEELEEDIYGTHEDTEDTLDPETLLGEEYAIEHEAYERAGEDEPIEYTAEEGPVAGPTVRHMFEHPAVSDENKGFWLGYDDNARDGFREAGVPFDALKRHLWISGTTGAGKSTILQNKAVQHAYAGNGFCNIDPKASGDTLELLQKIPQHRLDDVVFLEPSSSQFYREVGINMLDMPAETDESQREKEIESRLENLIAIFGSGKKGLDGARMLSIIESMGRAMLRHNSEVALDDDRDPSEKYTVIDLYFILLNAERRLEFIDEVDDYYLRQGLIEIAKMEDDEVRPLARRVKSWVENAIIRKIISKRDSTIDWDEIIDDDKILLVRIPVDSSDIHQMITLTVIRNLWSAKKRQDRDPDRELKPYFLQLDEFEKIANDNLAVEDMLVRARSMWLSVCLGTQYPNQIKSKHEHVYNAVENNANTKIAMRTPGEKDARILMSNFEGYDKNDLMNTNFYRCWTKLPLPDGADETDPLNLRTFAPYPPLRSEEEAKEIIERTLEEHGEAPLTDDEIQRELKFGDFTELGDSDVPGSKAFTESARGTEMSFGGAASEMTAEEMPKQKILEGIYAAQVLHEDAETPVPTDFAIEVIEQRFGETGYQSIINNCFEKYEEVDRHRGEGDVEIELTDHGKSTVFSADTGSSASGGGDDHRYILQESYKAFTKLGAITSLPTQEGESLPDGVARLPIDPTEEETLPAIKEAEEELKTQYPRLYEVSNGKHISIEAETSTIMKPMQTLTNLRKAIEANETCVFTCKDATFDDTDSHEIEHWPERGEKVIYDASGNGIDHDTILCAASVDAQGNRKFYNKTSKFAIDADAYAVRRATDPSDSLEWKEDGDAVIAETEDSKEVVAQFESPEAVGDPERTEVQAYREIVDDQWVVQEGSETHSYGSLDELREDWQDLYTPFIPENEFPRMPRDDDFLFVVFPDSANENYHEPMIYEQGEMEPLFTDDDVNMGTVSYSDEESEEGDEQTDDTDEGADDAADETPPDHEAPSQDQEQTPEGSGEDTSEPPESAGEQPDEPGSNRTEGGASKATQRDSSEQEPSPGESDSGGDSGAGSAQASDVRDSELPDVCPNCGEETSYERAPESDLLACEHCGYTPSEDEMQSPEQATRPSNEANEQTHSEEQPTTEDTEQDDSEPSETMDFLT
ncbi:type IV secretory system conjugative DNA transfer family protein [Halovenus marina]|uniref:type IV secretory system conjugative DNA transfer family protein n=1 Tax=Halovenus marina TaxID=3396621 RepID=UPI003F579A5C